MRLLSKLAMIRWHYFDYEVIDFKCKSTIITGDNATGKSTIIDALQVLFIANLQKIKFNSSAHEHKTERTLVSYLRGKIGSGQQSEEYVGDFLRNEDFTSYLAIEIEIFNTKNQKNEYYILGVVCDYSYKNNNENHEFFRIDNQRLDDKLFFDEPELPRTKEQFFMYLRKEGYSYEKYQSIEKYNDDVRHLLGGIKDSFFSLLQKGISFSPITNLRKFVYDYILDKQEIDISMMQDYVERTNELVDSIKRAEKQIELLKEIKVQHEKIEQINQEIIIGNYMEKRAAFEHLLVVNDRLVNDLSLLKNDIEEHMEKRRRLDLEKLDLKKENEILSNELINHNTTLKVSRLKEQIATAEMELKQVKGKNVNIKYKLKNEIEEIDELFKVLSVLDLELDSIQNLNDYKSLIQDLYNDVEFPLWPEQLSEFSSHWRKSFQLVEEKRFKWDSEREELNSQKKEIEEAIKQLKENQILSSDSPQMVLKKLLTEEFKSSGKNVSVDLLCEVIDIRDKEWRDAIEGYLHTQKFYILVEPKYFNQALQIYERNKIKFNLENVGLVDTEKIIKVKKNCMPNSLAEEIIVEDNKDFVIAYVNYLLGSVIKCSSIDDLRNHNRAITSTCMLYQGYVARQIPNSRYNSPYIGKNAVQVQLMQKKEELISITNQINNVYKSLSSIRKVLSYESSKEDRFNQFKFDWKDDITILSMEEHLSILNEQLYSLDTSEIDLLKERIGNNQLRINKIDDILPKLSEEIGIIKNKIDKTEDRLTVNKEQTKIKKDTFNRFGYSLTENLSNLAELKWESEGKEPIEIFNYFQESNKNLEKQKNDAWFPLVEMRIEYNNQYLFIADVRRETNDEYDAMLYRLEDSEIVKYREKAEEAREKAQQSFREDFIAQLKEKIEKAKSDFKEMNNILGELKFGTDRYHFRWSPNQDYREYYDMLTDPNLERGFSIFSESFDNQHGYVVNELFEKISGEESGKNSDLLDYRTYLAFELDVIDENGKTIHYSKVALEKSGGETQVPFYVAILASFYHTYHMGRKKDSFRLVIFDEAFNRMDANRVEEAIKFIENCGFQTLIVVPTGKVALLAPHFENSIIIMKENYHSFAVPVSINKLLEYEIEEEIG